MGRHDNVINSFPLFSSFLGHLGFILFCFSFSIILHPTVLYTFYVFKFTAEISASDTQIVPILPITTYSIWLQICLDMILPVDRVLVTQYKKIFHDNLILPQT